MFNTFQPWSVVESIPSQAPISLPLKQFRVSINHDELVRSSVPESIDGAWYYSKYYSGNGHLQTLMASMSFEKQYLVWYGRRYFKWESGSQVSVDYAIGPPSNKSEWEEDCKFKPAEDMPRLAARTRYLRPEEILPLDDPNTTTPLVISLHGLTGGSHENYVRASIIELRKRGFDCAVLNTRGCNRSKLSTPILFNAAWTEDIRQLISHITRHQPNRPIFLIGYSLGAAVLANYLGQEADDISPQIVASSIVAAPWSLSLSNFSLVNSFIGRNLYCKAMAANLCRVIRNNRSELEKSPLMAGLMANLDKTLKEKGGSINSIDEFDDIMTAPAFGFDSAYDYYRTCSPDQRMRNIRVPSLVLHSRDDPIVTDAAFPYSELVANPYLHTVVTSHGGHLGWFSADGGRWYANVLAKYFEAIYQKIDISQRVPPPPRGRRSFNDRFDTTVVLKRATAAEHPGQK